MKQGDITIRDNGTISLTLEDGKILMNMYQMAELFGCGTSVVKANIRALLKSGIVDGDYRHGGTQERLTILPDYFGLDTIIALAFRIASPQAKALRHWAVSRLAKTQNTQPQLFIRLDRQEFYH